MNNSILSNNSGYISRTALRTDYGYSDNDFIILYIAEFIERKNHEFLLRNIPELRQKIPGLKILLPGQGILLKKMKILAVELEIDDITRFPGYRKDISDICRISDVYVTTSRQEGLPISVVEALASGLPIVATGIRGQTDVIISERNGLLFNEGDKGQLINAILRLYKNPVLRQQMSENNVIDAEKYSVNTAVAKMAGVYTECVKL